jgi:beta-aspartyl-peptidase (threonine type)
MIRTMLASLLLLGCFTYAQETPVSGDLRKMLDEQTAAWNRGDLQGFMQGYWHSPELTFFSGNTISRGWEATLERYRQKYKSGGAQMGQLKFSDEKIDMLSPDSAVVSARWHLAMPDGKKLEGLTTVICKRMKDGWKIVHDHSS